MNPDVDMLNRNATWGYTWDSMRLSASLWLCCPPWWMKEEPQSCFHTGHLQYLRTKTNCPCLAMLQLHVWEDMRNPKEQKGTRWSYSTNTDRHITQTLSCYKDKSRQVDDTDCSKAGTAIIVLKTRTAFICSPGSQRGVREREGCVCVCAGEGG